MSPGKIAALAAAASTAVIGATLLATCDGQAAARGAEAGVRDGRVPTRLDLQAARRKVDRLECEAALGSTRKPYVVLDLEGRRLLFRLMGMTVREVPIEEYDARGLLPGPGADKSSGSPGSLAGIFTLRQKEGDPRLAPLTPEQIEGGLDDENAIDALPPDPPANYGLVFKERLNLRMVGSPRKIGVGGIFASLGSFWRSLMAHGADEGGRQVALRISLRLDETAAREVYRALVPDERFLILPASGLVLPDCGQALPRAIRAARPVARPTPPPTPVAPGVPFRIPPPVEIEQGEAAGPETSATPATNPEPPPAPTAAAPAGAPESGGGPAPR